MSIREPQLRKQGIRLPPFGLLSYSKATPQQNCAPCHSPPDGVRPVCRTTQPPGGFALGRSLMLSAWEAPIAAWKQTCSGYYALYQTVQ